MITLFRRTLFPVLLIAGFIFNTDLVQAGSTPPPAELAAQQRPNFLVIITDDHSWAHTSIEGYPLVKTPNFDAIAEQGIYFRHGFAPTPTCTSSRSAIISGQDFWRTGSGAVLMGTYPATLISYQHILQDNGYQIGSTGKQWGPGNQSEKPQVLGPVYDSAVKNDPADGILPTDYAKNLEIFLSERNNDKPFSFWVGISEPHRSPTLYSNNGYGETDGNRFATPDMQRYLPDFLPNTEFVRKDFQGYLQEIEEFDQELARIFDVLKKQNVLENTLIVITSDNGMDYTGSKASNGYYGVKVPFAVMWGKEKSQIKNIGINENYMVNGIDIAPTFLDAAGIKPHPDMTGISFLPLLLTGEQKKSPRNDYVITGYERHGDSRPKNRTYPSRAVITKQYMYIRNFLPERWPYGNPPRFGDTPAFMLQKDVKDKQEIKYRKEWLLGKRPAEMLFDITNDPFQKINLIATEEGKNKFEDELDQARSRLEKYLKKTDDPILKNPDHFSAMPYNQ